MIDLDVTLSPDADLINELSALYAIESTITSDADLTGDLNNHFAGISILYPEAVLGSDLGTILAGTVTLTPDSEVICDLGLNSAIESTISGDSTTTAIMGVTLASEYSVSGDSDVTAELSFNSSFATMYPEADLFGDVFLIKPVDISLDSSAVFHAVMSVFPTVRGPTTTINNPLNTREKILPPASPSYSVLLPHKRRK